METLHQAIIALIELNNYITVKDWDGLSREEGEAKYTSHGIDFSIDDFYPIGFGSITEHIVIAIFREELKAEDVLMACKEVLAIFKDKYSAYPVFDPKECDNFIDRTPEKYVSDSAEIELEICADNAKYFIMNRMGDEYEVKRLNYWVDFYVNTGKWLSNVKTYLDWCHDAKEISET